MTILKDGNPVDVAPHEVAQIAAEAFDYLASENGIDTNQRRIMIEQSLQLRKLVEYLEAWEHDP